MGKLRTLFTKFRRSESGATAVTVGLTFTVLVGAAGMAVDVANLLRERSNLQGALDSAVLAATSVAVRSDSELEKEGKKLIAANYKPSTAVSNLTSSFKYNKETDAIEGKADAVYKTYLLGVLGIKSVPFKVLAAASGRATDTSLELVLVLDKTGSMKAKIGGVTKLQAVKDAATSLVKEVMKAKPKPGAQASVKVGIVEIAEQMAVSAPDYEAKSWIDVEPPQVGKGGCSKHSWDCETTYYDCIQDGLPAQCPKVGNCKSSKETCSADIVNYWGGCLAYRPGYETAIDHPTNPKYRGIVMDWGNRCNARFLDLTGSSGGVLEHIKWMYGSGETYIPGGLLWGWNMLTPEEPLTAARSLADLGGEKVMVVMTDGANTRYVQADGTVAAITTPAQKTKTDDDTATLCTNIKSDGIKLFTIAFDVVDTESIKMLQDCASKKEMAYTASDVKELVAAFDNVVSQISSVRLRN